MIKPFITVVIPVYNGEKYIKNCLDSVIAQTYSNFEILIIDDASKDNSLNICRDYEQKYPNIRIIALEKNQGVMNARCLAIKEALGEYFCSVDADDYIEPYRLEKMAEAVVKNGSDIVITGLTRVFEKNGKKVKSCDSFAPKSYIDDELKYFKQNFMSFDKKKGNRRISPAVWMKLIKVDLVKQYLGTMPKTIKMGEDALISYLAILNCNGVTVLDDYSYYYRIFKFQTSGAKYYIDYFKNALSIYTYIEEQNIAQSSAINENIVHVSAYGVINEGFNKDKAEAKRMIGLICNTERVQQAISNESCKNQNIIFKLVAKNIKKKNFKVLYLIAKSSAFFMKLAS